MFGSLIQLHIMQMYDRRRNSSTEEVTWEGVSYGEINVVTNWVASNNNKNKIKSNDKINTCKIVAVSCGIEQEKN